MQPSLFIAENINTKSIYSGSVCASDTCVRRTWIKNTFFVINAYIKSVGFENTYIKDVDKKSICIEDTVTI